MNGTKSELVRCYGRKRRGCDRFRELAPPSVLENEIRRYEAAVKQAVAANTTTAAGGLPSWSHVFNFDGVGCTLKPVPVGGYEVFAADQEIDSRAPLASVELEVVEVFKADQDQGSGATQTNQTAEASAGGHGVGP